MSAASETDFFISYTCHDRGFAEWIAWILEAEGYHVKIQAWDFGVGKNFVLEMQQAASEAKRTIAVLSRMALESGFVQAEWAAAFAQDPTGAEQRLIPIRVGECTPTGLWAQIVYVDLVGVEEAEAEELVIQAAKRAITQARSKPAQKPNYPPSGEPAKPIYPPLIVHNLPFESAVFVGRERELEQIQQRLRSHRTVSIVSLRGMGGIGKTELVLQYAWRSKNAGLYPGGLCWINARLDVGLQLIQFARVYLGIEVPENLDLAGRVAFCLRQWQPGAVLLVLDDVQDYDAIADLFRGMESQFQVLLTTRSQIEEDSVSVLSIETLQPEAAYELLVETVQDARRFQENRAVADELCQWLGYLPLGIKLVAKFLKIEPDLSVAELLEELKAEKLEHDGLSKIEVVFELSWEKLAETERQLAMLLGTFAAAPIRWEWVEEAVAFCRVEAPGRKGWERLKFWKSQPKPPEQWCLLLEPNAIARGRRKLVESSLLERSGEKQYQVHPLLREFFGGKLVGQELRSIQAAVASVMIGIAKEIPDSPTLEIIRAVTAAIPHLQVVAEDLMKLESRKECSISDDDDLIWVFAGISRFYEGRGLYADAEPWFVAGLEVARSLFGERHPDVATSLNDLAALYYSQGRYEQAEPLYPQALELRRSLFGERHPAVATSLNDLAALYYSQGRYEEAEPLFIQALKLRQSLFGERHPAVATSLNNLAGLYWSQGRYEQAEPLYIQALELRRSLFGERHPAVATSLNDLALLYYSQGHYEEAEPLFIQALELYCSLFGERHPTVATSLNNLALLYYSQGHYEEAEPLFIQALELRRSLFGERHPTVATSLNNLAALYRAQGRYEEAEPLFIQALELRRSLFGERHPAVATSLNNLAELYRAQGRYEEAEPLFIQALELRRSLFGERHPAVATSLNSLAELYRAQGRYEEAEPLFIQALEQRQQLLGQQHPYTTGAQQSLEYVQRMMRQA